MSRPSCATCARPVTTCLCGWVQPTPNQLPVLLLQHPLEQHQAKGSARLLALSLAQCRLEVGETFRPDTLGAWLAALGAAPALLYPDTPALAAFPTPLPVPSPALSSARPTGLVVIDATWRKSLRLLHLNALLQTLPRVALTAPPPSRYAIRVARRAEQRSTLEATCLALAALEGGDAGSRYVPLLTGFDGFVATLAARAARLTQASA